MSERQRYVVVGGHPFRMYTGTTTFTGLKLVGKTDSKEEAVELFNTHYEDCGGLLMIVDLDEGVNQNETF